jgi:hypothetical protein
MGSYEPHLKRHLGIAWNGFVREILALGLNIRFGPLHRGQVKYVQALS